MARGRWTILPLSLTFAGIVLAGLPAMGYDTEQQLLARIQSEQNPVKKAKQEIKLASFKLSHVQDAYAQGKVEEGAKLLGTFVDAVKTSWKTLRDSGRTAAKQPQGFRELEISLREDLRALQDLARTVAYFDRAPLEHAVQELEHLHEEVIRALFPRGAHRTNKASPSPNTEASPGNPTEAR
jgi:hypothetical protein